MFQKKTVIVVGAGASQEVNLPIGTGLKNQIANLLHFEVDPRFGRMKGDWIIIEALQHLPNIPIRDPNPYLLAAATIYEAMPQAISIDHFVDAHSGNTYIELCSKLAIVRAILQAEKRSSLYFDTNRMNYQQLARTWFAGFMKLLTENCRINDLEDRLKSIVLIIFNYDRCIEHFLYHSLQNYYRINQTEAAKLVNSIEIYHPYGLVGFLPWQLHNTNAVPFGIEPDAGQLLSIAEQIKTFTEGTDMSASPISKIRKCMFEAEILVFLGFAFHRLNLELLTPAADNSSSSRRGRYSYFGTALGISDSDCDVIKDEIARLNRLDPIRAHLRPDLKCAQLFDEYWRSLSLS
jgi:hypothetical protein